MTPVSDGAGDRKRCLVGLGRLDSGRKNMAILVRMEITINESQQRLVPAGEFKTNCLRLMDEVHDTGEEIIVTKHRRPVVRVVPFRQDQPRLVGSCRGRLRILDDDLDSEPAIPLEDWEMLEPLAPGLDDG